MPLCYRGWSLSDIPPGYAALHPDRAQDARTRKVEAAAQSSKDRRAEGLAFWHSMMSKISDEA